MTRPTDDGQPGPGSTDPDARTRWEARERAREAEQAHDALATDGGKKGKGTGQSKSGKMGKGQGQGKGAKMGKGKRKGGRKWWRRARSGQ